jgi:protein phosphatase-4 regulatory subunit 3
MDYALSFQDPEGCAEVWNFILEVQQHLSTSGTLLPTNYSHILSISVDDQTNVSSSPLLGPETSLTTTSIIRSGRLPAPQLGIISEIERAIKQLARTQSVKERICEYIQHEVSFSFQILNTSFCVLTSAISSRDQK